MNVYGFCGTPWRRDPSPGFPSGVLRPEGVIRPDGVILPDGVLRLSPPCNTGVKLCTTTTGGEMVTGVTEGVGVAGVEVVWEGGVARAVAVGTYIGTDEIGFPMIGADGGTGEGGLLVVGVAVCTGL